MDWFKMQTVWGASVERFSDAEAGRFIKALFAYVRRGEEYEGSNGREDPIIWQAMEALRGDVTSFKQKEANQKAHEEDIKEKRKQAARARWGMQKDANACTCMQMDANGCTCIEVDANASQNKNKIENKRDVLKENPLKGVKEKRDRFSPPSLEEVAAYCLDRGNRVDPQHFIDFYTSKGWKVGNQGMKDWKACVRTWEQRDRTTPQQPYNRVRAPEEYSEGDI